MQTMSDRSTENMPVIHEERVTVGGRDLIFEVGRIAELAGGAVTIRYGDTLILSTATASKQPREGISFFPLTVDYEERMSAAGKIPGGFLKREGRPGEHAILSARLTDRPIRPLFPKGVSERRSYRYNRLFGGPAERPRYPLDHRRVGRADDVIDTVQGARRRCSARLC